MAGNDTNAANCPSNHGALVRGDGLCLLVRRRRILPLIDRVLPVFSLRSAASATFALVLVLPLIHMGLTYLITRNRAHPNLARSRTRVAVARQETVVVVLYGLVIFALGQAFGRAVWGAGFRSHMHGFTLWASRHTGAGEALTWAAYNFITWP